MLKTEITKNRNGGFGTASKGNIKTNPTVNVLPDWLEKRDLQDSCNSRHTSTLDLSLLHEQRHTIRMRTTKRYERLVFEGETCSYTAVTILSQSPKQAHKHTTSFTIFDSWTSHVGTVCEEPGFDIKAEQSALFV